MNFADIPVRGGVSDQSKVVLPFRELTESEAMSAVEQWTKGKSPGYRALKLFGSEAKEFWTVA